MTPRCRLLACGIAVTVASLSCARADAADPGVVFRPAIPAREDGSTAATVAEPADGQFVYSSELLHARPGARFAVGATPRTDFVLFSAEEQRALDVLSERQEPAVPSQEQGAVVHSAPSSVLNLVRRRARHTHRAVACPVDAKTPAGSAVSWPKVAHDGQRVCVPKLEFADQPDWRDHMWCFDKGDGSVR
jgi:hypothetical protein